MSTDRTRTYLTVHDLPEGSPVTLRIDDRLERGLIVTHETPTCCRVLLPCGLHTIQDGKLSDTCDKDTP